jgi:hypothetical protein
VEHTLKIAVAALTGLALLRSSGSVYPQPPLETLGYLPPIDSLEEKDFEMLWVDSSGLVVIEGPKRTRIVPMKLQEALRGLPSEWAKYSIDESSIGAGAGTGEVWIRKSAIKTSKPTSTWAFRSGAPVRTLKVVLRSGRHLWGVLP